MSEELENEEKKKDFVISDAFVTVKNCLILAKSYIENSDELTEYTPLYQILEDIENALRNVEPYYEEFSCIR